MELLILLDAGNRLKLCTVVLLELFGLLFLQGHCHTLIQNDFFLLVDDAV